MYVPGRTLVSGCLAWSLRLSLVLILEVSIGWRSPESAVVRSGSNDSRWSACKKSPARTASWVVGPKEAARRERRSHGQSSNRRARPERRRRKDYNEAKKKRAKAIHDLEQGRPRQCWPPDGSPKTLYNRREQGRMDGGISGRDRAHDSGMRSVELRNLRLADVDAGARRITIRKSKGDNGLFHTVILTNDLLKAVLTLSR